MSYKLETPDYINDIREMRKQPDFDVDEAAERMLKNSGVSLTELPIDIPTLARNLNFSLFVAKFNDPKVSGMMVDAKEIMEKFNSKRFIVCNREDYRTRQRFTLAHELGHFAQHCCQADDFFERYLGDETETQFSEERQELERQANKFAAALLMPKTAFRYAVESSPFQNDREKLTDELCKKFDVSPNAVNLRYIELGISFPN